MVCMVCSYTLGRHWSMRLNVKAKDNNNIQSSGQEPTERLMGYIYEYMYMYWYILQKGERNLSDNIWE